jgi:uncharacterized protein (TIGR02646 family)
LIKINKDFNDIPISLRVPDSNLETNEESILTHSFRLKVIEDNSFRNVRKKYPELYQRYKTPDIKEKLDKLYRNCGYCESEFTNSTRPATVEHYRPKGEYYWLAFSWDNIFYACGKCNNPQAGEKGKGNKFGISGTKVDFDPNDLSNINSLSEKYNTIEKPKFINPEFEDPEQKAPKAGAETIRIAFSKVLKSKNFKFYEAGHADEDGSWSIVEILDTQNNEILAIKLGFSGT